MVPKGGQAQGYGISPTVVLRLKAHSKVGGTVVKIPAPMTPVQ